MKKLLVLIYVGVICVLLLTACNFPKLLDVPAEGPDDATPAAAEAPEMPMINLAGPGLGTQMLWIDDSLLVFVPGGEFIMGATHDDNPQDYPEHPEHVVNQSGFWIYRSEVTNGMYANCVADGGCTSPATDITTDYLNPEKRNHPVVGVDWYQGQAYCSWADGHLPTEAQWEKTARGLEGNLYPWGEAAPVCDLLNFDNCVGENLPSGTYLSTTSPIRKYVDGASYYEALDMAGNVFEWVQDWYQRDYYVESPAADPPGPPDGETKGVRSSAFRSVSSLVPSVLRDYFLPDEYRDDLGFRCVVENPPYYAPACVYTPPSETEDCPPPTLDITDTYCQRKVGSVEFTVPEGSMVIYSAGSCTEISPNHYRCNGASGGYVNVQVCSDCGPSEETCPPTRCLLPYIKNPETCDCELRIRVPEALDSLEPVLPDGLAPDIDIVRCPPGQYLDIETRMCVPVNDPNDCFDLTMLMAVVPVECEECPPYSTYNEENGCCEPYVRAMPEPSAGTTCESFTLQLGVCDTPQASCTNPTQYNGNQAACVAAGCVAVPVNLGAGTVYLCTAP